MFRIAETKNFFAIAHRISLDLLFPIHCLGCGREGEWLCAKCSASIPLCDEQVCPACEKRPTPCGRTCFDCIGKTSLDGLLAVSSYHHPLLRKAVHSCKYRFLPDLHPPIGKLLAGALADSDLPLPDAVVPVPLHPRRLRWRGFNQSLLLAQHLADNLSPGFPLPALDGNLVRLRHTLPQMKIRSYRARQENMRGAFAVTDPRTIENASVLLVDDIATTGSTLFECARVLKEAGARKVFAVVIARQSEKSRESGS